MDYPSLIKLPIEQELDDFKLLFHQSLSSSNVLLSEALLHIRKKNGKMMRPILLLLIAKLYGKVSDTTLHAAVSLELLHTASLMHDDVVDESTRRRGQLSMNAIYNNKIAVLVGDYLLANSLVQVGKTRNFNIIDTASLLGRNLSEGEILQLSNVKDLRFSEQIYFEVIKKKTAALFSACTKVAALSVDCNDEEVEFARLFGEYVGICFQIKDDIFDYYNSKEIGKPTGIDMSEGKLTLPVIYALNSTGDANANQLAVKVKEGSATPDDIAALIEFTKQNGGIDYAKKTMYDYQQRCVDMLGSFSDSEVKKSLLLYLEYLVNRVK